jgi:DNA-binding response OmpR family regulator
MPRPRILLIDDSEATLEGLRSYLSPRFEVVTASDGLTAVTELGGKPFDLVIADLILPGLSGFSLISFLRHTCPRTAIIAMSGWERHSNGMPTVPGADILLKKPFDLEELDRCMDKLLVHKIR